MDMLTIALACSLYPDAALVETIVRDASRGHVFFVGDTVKLETYDHATSAAEAQKIVARVRAAGGNPVVGLMGIPPAWAERFCKGPDQLFDACANIAVGTAMLARFDRQCRASLHSARSRGHRRPLPRELLRPCVLGHVGRELGIVNFAEATLRELSTVRTRKSSISSLATADAALHVDPTTNRSLFFDESSAPPPTLDADNAPLLP
jgi:hypothetical protein